MISVLLLISMAATDLAYYHEFLHQNTIDAQMAEKERINYQTGLAIREAGKMIEQ